MWFRVISFNRSGSEDSPALALFQTLISNRRQLIESPDDQDFSQFVPGAYSPHPTKEQYPVRTPQTPSSQHNHISPPTPAQRRHRWETPTPYPPGNYPVSPSAPSPSPRPVSPFQYLALIASSSMSDLSQIEFELAPRPVSEIETESEDNSDTWRDFHLELSCCGTQFLLHVCWLQVKMTQEIILVNLSTSPRLGQRHYYCTIIPIDPASVDPDNDWDKAVF